MNETFVEHNQTTLTGFENMFHGPIKSKIFLNQNFMKKKKAYPTLKHDSGSIILWARVAASGNSEMFPMHIYSLCSNRNLSQRWPSFGIPLILCKHPEWLPMKLTGACYMQFLCKRLHKNAVQSNFYIKNTIQQQPGIFFFFSWRKSGIERLSISLSISKPLSGNPASSLTFTTPYLLGSLNMLAAGLFNLLPQSISSLRVWN